MRTRQDTGPVYYYRKMAFWAKNGFICVEDDREHKKGEYTTISTGTFRERAMAIGKSLRKFEGRQLNAGDREHRDALKKMVDQMLLCCRDAQEQGALDDPAVSAFFLRHHTFRPVRVSMSGRGHGQSHPSFNTEVNRPGDLPQGRQTGRTAYPDHIVRQSGLFLPPGY